MTPREPRIRSTRSDHGAFELAVHPSNKGHAVASNALGLSIDFPSMADLENFDDTLRIVDRVDDAKRPLANPISLLTAAELLASMRSGTVRQRANPSHES